MAEIDFSTGEGPQPHPVRFLDPRDVEKHFAPLLTDRPSAAKRWTRKSNADPFPGL